MVDEDDRNADPPDEDDDVDAIAKCDDGVNSDVVVLFRVPLFIVLLFSIQHFHTKEFAELSHTYFQISQFVQETNKNTKINNLFFISIIIFNIQSIQKMIIY